MLTAMFKSMLALVFLFSMAWANESVKLTDKELEVFKYHDYLIDFGLDGIRQEEELLTIVKGLLNNFNNTTTLSVYKKQVITNEQFIALMSNFIKDEKILAKMKNESKKIEADTNQDFDELKRFTVENKIDWSQLKIEWFHRFNVSTHYKKISKNYIIGDVFMSLGDKYFSARVLGFEYNKIYYIFRLNNFSPTEAGTKELTIPLDFQKY